MQLINAPGKLVLPFANAGAKNTIPVASQIGIVAGAASLTDGFPPLTRTPLAAGGVPPSGLDMNGVLYELSAIVRWANAGGGYVFDATFATDPDVAGYPKGARVLRSDGLGYWFNTVDGNETDPEANAVAAIAAGWVPDFTNGAAAVTMTNANVTLTPLQYGKPVIIISGTLSANLNLILPTGMVGEWAIINNTTGAYTITAKTAAGTGVVVPSAAFVVGDGTNIYAISTVDANFAKLNVAQNWSKGQSTSWLALPATTGTVSPDFTAGLLFTGQVTGACTFGNAYTTPGAGKGSTFCIRVQQGAASLYNWAFGTNWKYVRGSGAIPAQTQTLGAWDEIVGQILTDGTISFAVRSNVA